MSILDGLNERQLEAVTAPLSGRLQVVAGPGTGKTKVLTSRVAHMILNHGIKPHNILVTTFTKKAANEMKERLELMLQGSGVSLSGLYMGTFHSICYRILTVHGPKIGLSNYRVADETDSGRMLSQIVSNLNDDELAVLPEFSHPDWIPLMSHADKHKINPAMVRKQISSLKAQGITCAAYSTQDNSNTVLQFFYQKYTEELNKNKRFDFDDCLLYCHQLLTKYPVMNFIQHVVVDEFQDTNSIQLQLMFELAKGLGTNKHNVTVVGDPDQSIYAFRGAQSVNFEQMKIHYKANLSLDCNVITLNENYRSTSSILDLSEEVMRQASGRYKKSLISHAKHSFKTTHAHCENNDQEAHWIAFQIDQLLKFPHTTIQGKDIAILVRSSNETRVIEKALTKRSITYKMLKGRAFWSRAEVVTIIDIFRAVGDHNDAIAIFRSLGSLKGVGESSISNLQEQTRSSLISNNSILDSIEKLTASNEHVKTKKARDSVMEYISRIKALSTIFGELEPNIITQSADSERVRTLELYFDTVVSTFELDDALKDEEEKQGNIAEVRLVFSEFLPQENIIDDWIGNEDTEDLRTHKNDNFLVLFVDSIGLYQTSDDDKDKASEKAVKSVTISTIHGSKGLEWKAVFVPGLTEGIFPSRFSVKDEKGEAIQEERRCFYVATTRAKVLLYLSSVKNLGSFNAQVSRFIRDLMSSHMTPFHPEVLLKPKKVLQLLEMCNMSLFEIEPPKICEIYTLNYQNESSLPTETAEETYSSNSFTLFARVSAIPAGKAPAYAPVRQDGVRSGGRVTQKLITSILATSKVMSSGTKANNPISNNQRRVSLTLISRSMSAPSRAPAYIPVRLNHGKLLKNSGTDMLDTRTPLGKRYAPHYVVDRPSKKGRPEEP